MERSLLDQFRGAIAGAVLGLARQPSPYGWIERFSLDGEPNWERSPQPIPQPSSPGQRIRTILHDLTHALIHHQDALTVVESHGQALTERFTAPDEVALALLPVLLFWHDEPQRLRHYLHPLVAAIAPPSCLESVLLIGQTLSHLLTSSLTPPQLVPQLMAQLHLNPETSHSETSPLGQQLRQIQTWLETSPGLAGALASGRSPQPVSPAPPLAQEPDSWPTVLALYSFLCTPDDFKLSQQRISTALAPGGPNPSVAGLVGALVGAYRGDRSLPLEGHRALAIAANHGLDIRRLATQLFAAWAGVHQPQMLASSDWAVSVSAIAPALRPLPGLVDNSLLDDRP
ncbi:MAG: ADP-ribosylglycohydrolase family protein [Synechococcales bacterium]|nr:ADP-ribosylglycohydrolase family protein [Synechococcales bacterium]